MFVFQPEQVWPEAAFAPGARARARGRAENEAAPRGARSQVGLSGLRVAVVARVGARATAERRPIGRTARRRAGPGRTGDRKRHYWFASFNPLSTSGGGRSRRTVASLPWRAAAQYRHFPVRRGAPRHGDPRIRRRRGPSRRQRFAKGLFLKTNAPPISAKLAHDVYV